MPRPIQKEDLKRLRKDRDNIITKDNKLGYVIRTRLKWLKWPDRQLYAYSLDQYGYPCWVGLKTLRKRQLIGHPNPRRKPKRTFMREPDFGLEELASIEEIVNGG